MKKEYLVLVCSEDGPSVSFLDKQTLKKRLEDKYWGDITWFDASLTSTDSPMDLMAEAGRGIIIKGNSVVPKSRAVAWEYDVG